MALFLFLPLFEVTEWVLKRFDASGSPAVVLPRHLPRAVPARRHDADGRLVHGRPARLRQAAGDGARRPAGSQGKTEVRIRWQQQGPLE